MERNINMAQFGKLYHGTSSAADGAETIDSPGHNRYSAHGNQTGYNFASTSAYNALDYAETSAEQDTRSTGVKHEARVFQVEQSDPTADVEVDPLMDGGFMAPDMDTALELADNGSEVSLRTTSPLKIVGGLVPGVVRHQRSIGNI